MFLLISTFSSLCIYVLPLLIERTEEETLVAQKRYFHFHCFTSTLSFWVFLLSLVLYKDKVDIVLPIRVNPLAFEMSYFSVFIILVLEMINLITVNTNSSNSVKV